MNKNIEKIDRYLKGIALPEHISEQHRRQLRRQILNRTERRQTMFVRKRASRVRKLSIRSTIGNYPAFMNLDHLTWGSDPVTYNIKLHCMNPRDKVFH